jgi:hypothetical protein
MKKSKLQTYSQKGDAMPKVRLVFLCLLFSFVFCAFANDVDALKHKSDLPFADQKVTPKNLISDGFDFKKAFDALDYPVHDEISQWKRLYNGLHIL